MKRRPPRSTLVPYTTLFRSATATWPAGRFMCRFSAAGLIAHPRAEAAGGRKAPRHEVAGYWAVAGSERYGGLDISAELVCGREADTPSASMAVGRDRESTRPESSHP